MKLLLLLLFGLCLGEECCGPGISTDCVPCIPLCCPTGEVRMTDTKWTPHRCHLDEPPAKTCAEPTLENLPDFTKYHHQGKRFGLLPSKDKFVCPDPEQGLIPADLFYYNISLLETGELVGIHPLEVGVKIINHSNSQFCLVYAQSESTENETNELSVGFMICTQDSQPVDQGSKEFTMIFYPCALIISSMFLLFTIISYILDPDLHRPLFGKITLGFIINLLLTYICLTTGYISRNLSGVLSVLSVPCILLGYLTLYFFFSFMFWINAMAASICFKFSSILSTQTDNEKKRFIMNFLYAQGLPVVLCIIIAEIDRYGSCSWIRPDMGVAQCFIGTPRGEMMGASSFFKTAEFMYFQGILLVLQITNIVFFLITVYFLVDHWRKSSYITKTGENKGNFLIVVKLFFIMGIPWLGELLSHSLTHVMGPDASFYYRVVIDCANLFTGVLVFLVLVCKKKTVTRVRTRLQHNSQLSRGSTLTTSTKDTVQWYRDKDSVHQTRDTRGGDQLRLKVFFRNQPQQTAASSIRSTSNQEDYL